MGLLDGVLGIGGAIGGGIAGILGGNSANDALQQGVRNATNTVNKYGNNAMGYQQPTYNYGQQALGAVSQGNANGSFAANPYGFQMDNSNGTNGGAYGQQPNAPQNFGQQPNSYQVGNFNFKAQPGYGFQQQQGAQGIGNAAASGGQALSGASQKALGAYTTNLANQSYNSAFNQYLSGQGLQQQQSAMGLNQYNQNRAFTQGQYQTDLNQYNTNRATALGQQNTQNQMGMMNSMNQFNTQNQSGMENYQRQMGVAGMGQQAGNNMSGIQTDMGNTLGNLQIQAANGNAANSMNMANSIGGMFNNMGSMGINGMMGYFGSGGIGSMFGGGQNYQDAYNNLFNYNAGQ